MKICVFCAASNLIDPVFIERVERLGEMIAERGHQLVFGAGGCGLMGAAARGAKRKGGYVYGIIPQFFKDENIEPLYEECDKVTYTTTMGERKQLMEEVSDAFVVAPGGVGTLEELFEVLTLKQLGRLQKPVAVFNLNGYYNDLEQFLYSATCQKFISCSDLYATFSTAEEVLDYLEYADPKSKAPKSTD